MTEQPKEEKTEEKTEANNEPGGDAQYDSAGKAAEFAKIKEEDIAKSLQEIEEERKTIKETRRFGYFSIPYPATVGDQAYSQKEEYPNHKVVDRKVVIEKRGIYTNNPKSGKGPDAYFLPVEPVSDAQVDEYKKQSQKDREDY